MGKLKWLSQNGKMKKSSQGDTIIFNWGIPAFMSQSGIKTCPKAKHCVAGCYARSGTYRFSNVAAKYEARLDLALSTQFEPVMQSEIDEARRISLKQNKKCLIRIHDSGDFFNLDYTLNWFRLIRLNPDIQFYAYTKMVQFFEDLSQNYTDSIPTNLILIYSYGGSEDNLIDRTKHRHSKVFQSEAELVAAGYINASQDDTLALTQNKKVGLVYHGSKSYAKTTWDRVS
jgi:hypothetical protein